MKIILALICFLTMLLHSFFGYFLYVKGESVFEPENVVVALTQKSADGTNKLDVFKKAAKPSVGMFEAEKAELVKEPESTEPKAEQQTEAASSETPSEAALKSDASEQTQTETAEAAPQETKAAPEPQVIEFSTGWSGFLQVENAMIAVILFFLGFAVCCVKGRGAASRWVFGFNLIFWSSLGGFIWLFMPVNTPLNMLKLKFAFPEFYFILGGCALAALLSFLLFLGAFRSDPDKKKKALEKQEQAAKVETPAPAPAVKPEEKKASRFGFGFGKKKDEETKVEKSELEVAPEKPETAAPAAEALDKPKSE